jgi:hypothetical protein
MMPGVDSERLRPFLLVGIDGVLSVYDVEACPERYEEFQLFACSSRTIAAVPRARAVACSLLERLRIEIARIPGLYCVWSWTG